MFTSVSEETSLKNNLKTVVLSTRVPEDLAKKVNYVSKTRGYLNISDFIRDAIRKLVEYHGGENVE
ncbi:hypothetical protein DRO45_00180 [Candidatus Bathyarchaeota archaeon]|nr:MAG: hypothetical protein DRO45_00180 [Candidatus Bathyarchaeota archaeon]